MMDVGVWLRGLGLGQYEAAFRENEIDDEVLPNLTAEDLKELGVMVVGHRRKLLSAIASLDRSLPAPNMAATAPPSPLRGPHDQDTAERRQLTVMFVDLVGSTAMSARLDPEDMREIVGAYHRSCAEQITKAAGFVAKYMGDGVLAYFGYPEAHEHDAERAVLAGLALAEAVPKLKTAAGAPLQVRVGISTGLVVVGDLIGSGEAQERGVVGDTPNLAARLQALAEPNMVVIADSTRRLLGNLFELSDLGPQYLKGIAAPSRAWAALRASSVESRFEALHTTNLTTLVGRDEEFEALLRRWSRAKSGEGQVVLIAGEAGIGKSRLTAALLEHLAAESHARLRYFCSPQHSDSAFHPFIDQMGRVAGLSYNDNPQVKLDKLNAALAQTSTSPENAALFAEMLSLVSDGRYPAQEFSAEQRRQKTLEALSTQFAASTRQKPLLMIFEDAHWTDPTSLEVLGRTVDRIKTLPALMIVTFRPEFNAPWVGQSHVMSLTLNRLGEHEAASIIAGLVGNENLPADVMAEIVERTDGIPLFVEEMTKAVLEAESESSARRLVTTAPYPALAVPASLHASLMARLDRLGSAKEVAQIGAAIGREFSHALLASVARKSEAELGAALDRLVQAGLLFRQGVPPNVSYLFKHALVLDAAYGTLLREPRRLLHARVAVALETNFATVIDSQPELLARHCTEAGQIDKAVALWRKAGQRSLERSALAEAAEQYSRALAQISTLTTTAAARGEQIELQVALITPLMHLKGYAAPETKAASEQARRLIQQAEEIGEAPEDQLLLFSALYGVWVANFVGFNGEAMHELAAQFLTLAESQETTVPLMVGYRIMGITLLFTGDIVSGRAHLERAITLYDPLKHRHLATQFGQDVGVGILSWSPLALWLVGYPDAALAAIEHALVDAREIGQAATLMLAMANTLSTHIYCGTFVALATQADELLALADEKGAALWRAFGMTSRGCLYAHTGKAPEAIQTLTSGIAAFRSSGSTFFLPGNLSTLALAYAELEKFNEAWNCIGEAVKAAETTGELWSEAEIQRTAGEIARRDPLADVDSAERYFHRALSIAGKQQAKSWELRAAMSMARLWRDQGKRVEARELLAPIYGWFTEGFDTLDLKEAKALLAELHD
jgi:class 3 adenylate cyclase/predicted ATPase